MALGNPDLEPETISTAELAFDYQPIGDLRMGFNLFRYQMSDLIRFVPDPSPATSYTAQNTGEQTAYGLEWEFWWKPARHLDLYGNYAFQRSRDETTDTDAGNAPHHQFYLRADWRFRPEWYLTPQMKWIADRERVAGDRRSDPDDYQIVDITLRRTRILEHWEAAVSVRNLFDEDAREPSPAPGFIPNDLPLDIIGNSGAHRSNSHRGIWFPIMSIVWTQRLPRVTLFLLMGADQQEATWRMKSIALVTGCNSGTCQTITSTPALECL